MLFPHSARASVCESSCCPNRFSPRTKGVNLRQVEEGLVREESRRPDVAILFRDPVTRRGHVAPNVLDIKFGRGDRAVRRQLLGTLWKHLLRFFPMGTVVYLDNFIRCPPPNVTLDELNPRYWHFMSVPGHHCSGITMSILRASSTLRCLVVADQRALKGLYRLGLVTTEETEVLPRLTAEEEDSTVDNTTVYLGKRFLVNGLGIPAFFFPHPGTLGLQYATRYSEGENHEALMRATRAILAAVGEGDRRAASTKGRGPP